MHSFCLDADPPHLEIGPKENYLKCKLSIESKENYVGLQEVRSGCCGRVNLQRDALNHLMKFSLGQATTKSMAKACRGNQFRWGFLRVGLLAP